MVSKKISERGHWDRFWDDSGRIEEVYSNEGRITERLLERGSPRGLRVLEVGAGSGRDGLLLSRAGADVVSLDYSLPSLRVVGAQLDSRDSLVLCCGDAFSLPFADGTFDIVFHQGLLEHFRNPDDLLAENVRVLRRGGYILVDVPQRYHYYTLIKHCLIGLGKWFAGWECEYSVGQLERTLERHGLEVVTSYGEWFNPPIWYRMLRKVFLATGVRLPMYPGIFAGMGRIFGGLRAAVLGRRWGLYTALVIGTIARKE